MKHFFIVLLVIVLAAVIISGLIPTSHTIRNRSSDYSFETDLHTWREWNPRETFYEPGWLVKLFVQ